MELIILGFLAFLAISLVIVIHELGHFVAARRSGVWVEEFGLGLPPRIWGKQIGETLYSVNAIPLGGFVRLHGETQEAPSAYPERAFVNKNKKVRAFIALAGVFMNFVLAIVCFSIFYTVTGIPQERDTGEVKVLEIVAESPAQASGIVVGDVIKKVDNIEVRSASEFIAAVGERRGKQVRIEVERVVGEGTETKTLTARLRDVPPEEGAFGVVISSVDIVYYFPPLWQRPLLGTYQGFLQAFSLVKSVVGALGGVASSVSKGQVPRDIVGPAGLFGVLVYVIKQGLLPSLNFIGLISVNLAVINLVPFPPLDGSRVLFLGLERVVGRKRLPKVETYAHTIGMILLIGLMLAISWREIPRIISGGVTGFVESLIK